MINDATTFYPAFISKTADGKKSLIDAHKIIIFLDHETRATLEGIPTQQAVDLRMHIVDKTGKSVSDRIATIDLSLLCAVYLRPVLRDWESGNVIKKSYNTNNNYPVILAEKDESQNQLVDIQQLIIQFDHENHLLIELISGTGEIKLTPCCLNQNGEICQDRLTQLNIIPGGSNIILLTTTCLSITK